MKRGNFCQHFPSETDGENLPAAGTKSLNYFPSGLSINGQVAGRLLLAIFIGCRGANKSGQVCANKSGIML
jgi:hypothetical protein